VREKDVFFFDINNCKQKESTKKKKKKKKSVKQKISRIDECMAGEVQESQKDDHMPKNSKVWRLNVSLV
jgi:hypothetical protein